MENTSSIICFNCNKSLPDRAKFCSACRTQVRCKECGNLLEKDDLGCIECGADVKVVDNELNNSFNSISIRETLTERNIEAKFSNEVGKDLTGILRDAMTRTSLPALGKNISPPIVEDAEYQELPKVEGQSKPVADETGKDDKRGIKVPEKSVHSDHLPLLTVAMRALPASESEWVLLYCYYASEFGTKPFTRPDIIAKYKETNRWETEKSNSLSANIKANVRAQRLNAFGENYSILESGVNLAEEILSRTKSTVLQSKGKKTKGATTEDENGGSNKKKTIGGNKTKRLNDIDFFPEGKDSLEVFYSKYTTKNDYERILLFVYYLKEVISIQNVTYDHIYTSFETLNIKTPLNVPQITRNSVSKQGWIDISNSKNIIVTTNGRNKIRSWNKDEK